MPQRGTRRAHYVLSQTHPGRIHRLSELITEACADELAVRREINKLALAERVKRLFVGEHVMLKKTDEFDADDTVGVDSLGGSQGSATMLDPTTYELSYPRILDPVEGYSPPENDGLVKVDVVKSGNIDD